jgi:hypothetical protein
MNSMIKTVMLDPQALHNVFLLAIELGHPKGPRKYEARGNPEKKLNSFRLLQ